MPIRQPMYSHSSFQTRNVRTMFPDIPLCFYCLQKLREKNDSRLVAPALLYIHRAASENYSPVIQMGEPRKSKEPVDNFAQYEGDFRENLKTLLEDIFNPDISFTQTEIEDKCAYCDFRALCKNNNYIHHRASSVTQKSPP